MAEDETRDPQGAEGASPQAAGEADGAVESAEGAVVTDGAEPALDAVAEPHLDAEAEPTQPDATPAGVVAAGDGPQAVAAHAEFKTIAVLASDQFSGAVRASILARSIRRARPSAQVLLVAQPGPAKLAKGLGFNASITVQKEGAKPGWSGAGWIAERLARVGCDALLVPHGTLFGAMVAYRSNLPVRVGFGDAPRGLSLERWAARFAYTHAVSDQGAGAHYLERLHSLLDRIGVPAVETRAVYRPTVEAKKEVTRRLDLAGVGRAGHVALAPGSTWPTKRWPEQSYARLADTLLDSGLVPVVLGGGEERALYELIRAQMVSGDRLLDSTGVSLDQASEMMRRARCVVVGDTGLLHLGAAVGARAVALFGPTNPELHAWPDGVTIMHEEIPCRPCSEKGLEVCPEGHHNCLRHLTPKRVWRAVSDVLDQKR